MELRDKADAAEFLDQIINQALESLYIDLCNCDWYVREHEIVNLFVFNHLVPVFQQKHLDLSQIGIEFPVLKVRSSPKEKMGARKDVVIWPTAKTTLWKDCHVTSITTWEDVVRTGRRPFAIMEWKNLSKFMTDPLGARRKHEDDVAWLLSNSRADMVSLGYAVLVDQTGPGVALNCRRIQNGECAHFLALP